jgi:uncharacterized membrane protein
MQDLIFAADHGQLTFRWVHVLAGVIWLGILYFFNLINSHFMASLDAETKRKVVPELMPRALYWFRWGAVWTWGTGVCLLFVMYYVRDAGNFFDGVPADGVTKPTPGQWGVPFGLLFVGFAVYDLLFKLVGSKSAAAHAACVLIWGALAVGFFALMRGSLDMSGRAAVVHVGALFGTVMAANVWMRIWPAQRRIITAIKRGDAPDSADVGLAGARSKHNTYMSVALLLLMIGVDQTRLLQAAWWDMAMILGATWLVTFVLYRKAARVKGF